MKINNVGQLSSVFSRFILELRDVNIQKDRMRFRRNIERIGEIFAYEISKIMKYEEKIITTPLGKSVEKIICYKPVLATILRAGIPLHQGLLNYFDDSDNCFIAAYRKGNDEGGFEIKHDYISSPSLEDKVVILSDPMLASGKSMVTSVENILTKGNPKHIHIVSVIASSDGIEFLKSNLPVNNCTLWIGAEDEEMTDQSYIYPGLGDAGDLAFGSKI